jgi:ABC-type multidrug transport system fused ATPase/permease subunit
MAMVTEASEPLASSNVSYQFSPPPSAKLDKKPSIQQLLTQDDDREHSTEPAEKTIKYSPAFRNLFKYAVGRDYCYIACGLAGAIGMGVIQPFIFYYVGRIYTDLDPENLREDFYDNCIFIVYLFLGSGALYVLCAYIAVIFFALVGSRQANHFRREYMRAVLRQDPEWYDSRAIAELPNALTSDTIKIEKATGDKLAMVVFTAAMILSALIISIYQVLQLTLVSLAFAPLMIGGMYMSNKALERNAKMDDQSYKKAGGIVEEALSEIKTVQAHNAQGVESTKYINALQDSYYSMLKSGFKVGFGIGFSIASYRGMMAAIYVTAAALIRNHDDSWTRGNTIDVGCTVISISVCLMAFNNVGVLMPCIKIIIEGSVVCADVLNVLGLKNKIVSGKHKAQLEGFIELRNVKFAYPSALQTPILKDFSATVAPGDTLAILGETGSGKSSVINLLMRFYDPQGGTILIDDVNIKEWDLAHLRSQIGLVSQEPILFNGTIKDNIRFGLPSATDEDIEEAAKESELLNLVSDLTGRFDTQVGGKGSQLSGGERQRIAIARAVIRKPKLLLLDESTSALDKNTEAAVQLTLSKLMSSCTTIMIAHRISTIRKATKIVILRQGEIVESGTQEELMAKQGYFYHILNMQNMRIDDKAAEPSTSPNSHRRRSQPDIPLKMLKNVKMSYGRRITGMMEGGWKWIIIGCIGAAIPGVTNPLMGWLTGLEIDVLQNNTGEDLVTKTRLYAGLMGVCAVCLLIGLVLQSASFPLVSARVTRVMRQESFKALLSYDPAFFDQHSSTVLGTKLSSDCEKVNGLGGNIFGFICGVVCSMFTAFIVSGVHSWQIMLVVLAVFPLFLVSLLSSFFAQAQGLVSYKYEDATVYASDCILNYKTVKAFGMEDYLLGRYLEVIEKVSKGARKKSHYSALSFGIGYGLLFYVYALMFWFAARMFYDGHVSFKNMNIALYSAMNGTFTIFLSAVFAPDIKQGQEAAKALFRVLDYEPKIDPNSEEGCKESILGAIKFSHVTFKYPTRDVFSVFDVSFTIPAGSTFAIVGTTGSGKSTITQLLLRCYDTTEGSITIDYRNIKDYNVRHLRNQIAVVGQEPVLFSGSISSNIAYGIEASEEEIKKSAEQAQALDFIESNSDGFARDVGIRGSHLSGGEKQRIAIARAIIRKPKILILDEATSALDSDTESKLVDIMRGLMAGRTCLVVAHRIKTIASMDQIAALYNGELLEIGSFKQLMEKKGFLYSLAKQR